MRLGTRGSPLALAQARQVAELLGGAEIVTIRTSGDEPSLAGPSFAGPSFDAPSLDGPSFDAPFLDGASFDAASADKSRWVSELEQALLAEEIDVAVHSAKDVPAVLAPDLELLGAPKRAAIEDVLCGATSVEALAEGARIGTTSLRRIAQLRAAREDIEVVAVTGNVDTRLRKLKEGACEALLLARAGLLRLGLESEVGAVLDAALWVPAPGQGTLALEGRADDGTTRAAVAAISDGDTWACLQAERALAKALGASCNTPLGAYAAPAGCGCFEMRAWVGAPDGSAWVKDEMAGGFYDPQELGERLAQRMLLAGAGRLLEGAQSTPSSHI
jgi:hydroxymethylbilane synthase